jgi:hemolysin activation/secretion protein
MNQVKKIVSRGLLFLLLGCLLCFAEDLERPAGPGFAKSKAQLEEEEKVRTDEELRAKREAAAKAKREAQEQARAKKEEEKRIARLNAEAKKQAKTEIAAAKQEKKAKIAGLSKEATPAELAAQKKQIEAEYQETVAKIKMKLRLQTGEQQIKELGLPEDVSQRFTARDVSINGNNLVSTAQLLDGMPLVYNASDKPLKKAEKEHLYDLRVVFDLILNPGEPREVSARTIQGFTQYILSAYQEYNYAGIYVYVPAEMAKEGKLQDEVLSIEILEAKVSGVAVTQYDPNQQVVERGYLDPCAVMKWSPVHEEEVINQKKLDDFVNLLNENPDRYVSAVVSKGDEPKTLAVGYDIYEADPWHYYVQVDSSGTEDRQWNPKVGLINTNLTGKDDKLNAMFQFPVDDTIEDNYATFGSYDFPLLGPRLRLMLYGGNSEYDISGAGNVDFLGNGWFYGSILRFNALQMDGWFVDVTGSLSREESKVNPSLPTTSGSDVDLELWGAGVEAYRSDDISNSFLGFNRLESMGGSSATSYEQARTGASPDFRIYTASAAYSRLLDPDKIQRASASVRWINSSDRLVPAKMTTFGGLYTVRGYEEEGVVTDGGLLVSTQYEFDLVRYEKSKEVGEEETEEMQGKTSELELRKLAPLAFFDFGRAVNKHATTSEEGVEELASVGTGLIFEVGDNFSAGVYVGYPLRGTTTTAEGNCRLSASALMRW